MKINLTIGADGPHFPYGHNCCNYLTTLGHENKLYDIYYCPKSVVGTMTIVSDSHCYEAYYIYPNRGADYDGTKHIQMMFQTAREIIKKKYYS